MAWICLLIAAPLGAQEEASEENNTDAAAVNAAVADRLEKAFVVVEYTAKYDKGEEPYGWIPGPDYAEECINQERPMEDNGLLLDEKTVIANDPMMHPRFIEAVHVRFGDKRYKAKPLRYAKDQFAVIYEVEKPVEGAQPLGEFDTEAEGPYRMATFDRTNGQWTINVQSMPSTTMTYHGGRTSVRMPMYCIVTDKQGNPVGMCMNTEIPTDDSWKVSPMEWAGVPAKQYDEMLRKTSALAEEGLYRVKLHFRSPKKSASDSSRYYYNGDEEATEKEAVGMMIGEKRMLILTELKPKVTARLERVVVHVDEQKQIEGEFACTLKDYGGLVAELKEPLGRPIRLCTEDIRKFENLLAPCVQVRLQGDERQIFVTHSRITNYELGWKEHLYPDIQDYVEGRFLFNEDGELLAMPVSRRMPGGEDEYGYSYYNDDVKLTAGEYLKPVLDAPREYADASNVPLSEEEENRIAWLGLELQALDEELARVNNVSDLTQNGQSGALISYVYPDSPADKAGIEAGWIILRLHVEDRPKPLDVTLEDMGFYSQPFPWARLDEVPEQYYEQIPRPWPPAENNFTRMLTDLGFGKKFTADFFHDEEVVKKDFEVTQSPTHYDTAPKYKSEPLGLTVRNMTYETRRYYRRPEDDPGVIVSKVEPGSKASVAGIKPFEIITHVNDQPVMNSEDFEKFIAEGGELRFSVKRWTKGRVVKIQAGDMKDSDETDPQADTSEEAEATTDQTDAPSETEREESGETGASDVPDTADEIEVEIETAPMGE
jgi:S1-C subfamily serine protease